MYLQGVDAVLGNGYGIYGQNYVHSSYEETFCIFFRVLFVKLLFFSVYVEIMSQEQKEEVLW